MAGIGIALLCTLLAIALRTGEASGQQQSGDGCSPSCVILIQVDGLEPKDVTEQTTPYLWRLAHPTAQGQNVPGSALSGRSGWIWQAPRGVMSTGTAPATASLLSGGYPEKTGVPADDFYGPTENSSFQRQRLTAGNFGDVPGEEARAATDAAEPIASLGIDTLIGVVRDTGGDAAIFLGDPGLAELTGAKTEGNPYWFPPGTEGSATHPGDNWATGDPRLCPIPRYPDGGARIPSQVPQEANFNPSHCPASDMATTQKAITDLKLAANATVGFTFMHLAELGVAKRLASDVDVDDPEDGGNTVPEPPQPAQALANTDAAIASFAEQYAQHNRAKWDKTVVMVVGTHGYQRTPLINRIPDPSATPGGAANELNDLSDYMAKLPGVTPNVLKLVPQGTMATLYYDGPPEDRADALVTARAALKSEELKAACRLRNPSLPDCIREVYYVDPAQTPLGEPSVAEKKTWRLDPRDPKTGARTNAAGDLVVELGRGWAAGRAVGMSYQGGLTGQPVTNANTGSSGGPQERAVAALINGPSQEATPGAVRNLDSLASSQLGLTQIKYYPVSNGKVDPSNADEPPPANDPRCPDVQTDPGGLACANRWSEVGNDANDPGHEAQPETVDFAVTISALMQLPFEVHPDQLQGRVLQEAFLRPLATPCVGEDCDPPEVVHEEDPPPEPPLPPPDVVVVEEGFKFRGLVQKLKARVVDARGRPYSRAARGVRLSRVQVEADFGKPESAVTLTFYRKASQVKSSRRSRSRGRRRAVRIKPIARFDPFVVKRGHVTMKLKLPKLFKPTYIGVTVREIAQTSSGKRRLSGGEPCTTLKTRKKVPFRCTGPSRGVIARIVDAGRLHKRKGAPLRSRSRRR